MTLEKFTHRIIEYFLVFNAGLLNEQQAMNILQVSDRRTLQKHARFLNGV